jgi:hypothetical protein
MEKRTFAWMPAAPCGLKRTWRGALALLLLVSASWHSEPRAQTISFTDQQSLLEAYRKQQDKHASPPETYTAPLFDLSSDSASAAMPPQLPSFDTTVAADVDSMLYDDSRSGPSTPITGKVTTALLLAQL